MLQIMIFPPKLCRGVSCCRKIVPISINHIKYIRNTIFEPQSPESLVNVINDPVPVTSVEGKFYNYIVNNPSPRYLKRTQQALSAILPRLKAKFINNISAEKIGKYKETIKQEVSASTVNIELSAIKDTHAGHNYTTWFSPYHLLNRYLHLVRNSLYFSMVYVLTFVFGAVFCRSVNTNK